MLYRVKLSQTTEGNIISELPDFPGVFSFGKNENEALAMVRDALLTVCAQRIQDKEVIPVPSKRPKLAEKFIDLPPMAVAKVAIHNAMLAKGLSQVALAERLATDPKSIRRLLDLDHNSQLPQLEAALAALGYKFRAEVTPIALSEVA